NSLKNSTPICGSIRTITFISTNSNFSRRPMEKNSKFKPFYSKLEQYVKEGSIPPKYADIIEQFYLCYQEAISSAEGPADYHHDVFVTLLTLIKEQCQNPFDFQPYHALIRKPFDYYQFGLDLVKPLVDLPHSTVSGMDHLKHIADSLEKGENA